MKKEVFLIIVFLFLIGCTPEEASEPTLGTPAPDVEDPFEVQEIVVKENTAEIEETPEEVEEDLKEIIIEEPVVEETPEPQLINGKTVEERIEEAINKLHAVGSADHARENFPDTELVFTDYGEGSNYPSEIFPFEYYYSAEANRTFNLCAIHRTVFICEGKLEHVITDEEMNSEKCVVTPIYQ